MTTDPTGTPDKKALRDARRQAHEAQQRSGSGNDKKGKKGKGDSRR